jgi:hypothetical protein
MTQRALKQLRVLSAATVRNSPRVHRKLSKAGKRADSAVVTSAAKYYVALKKLAEK